MRAVQERGIKNERELHYAIISVSLNLPLSLFDRAPERPSMTFYNQSNQLTFFRID